MLTPEEINNKILVWLGKSYQQGSTVFTKNWGNNVNLQDPPTKDDIDKLKSVFTPYGTHKIKEYLINLFLHKFKMNTNHIRLIKN